MAKCSMCGKEMDVFDENAGNVIDKTFGYGSRHDGEHVHLEFCCECFDKLMAYIAWEQEGFAEEREAAKETESKEECNEPAK